MGENPLWQTLIGNWYPPRNYVKFEEAGKEVFGTVVHYSPNIGETHRDNATPCGFLDLDDFQGNRLRISLDKPSLTTQVSFALPKPGDVLRVRFAEEVQGAGGNKYKRFEVFRSVSSEEGDGRPENATQGQQAQASAAKPFDKKKFDSQIADFQAVLGTITFNKVLDRLGVKNLSTIASRDEAGPIYMALKKEVDQLNKEE